MLRDVDRESRKKGEEIWFGICLESVWSRIVFRLFIAE